MTTTTKAKPKKKEKIESSYLKKGCPSLAFYANISKNIISTAKFDSA
jgi:hypothetical protein